MLIGQGKGFIEGEKIRYEGTMPICKDGEELRVIRKEDLDQLMRCDEIVLLRQPFVMPNELFAIRHYSKGFRSQLPDQLIHKTKEGDYKLFLDRHLYSSNPKDMLWIRYANVDQFLIEDGR